MVRGAIWDGRGADEADWDCGLGAEVVGGLVEVFGVWGGTGGSKAPQGSWGLVFDRKDNGKGKSRGLGLVEAPEVLLGGKTTVTIEGASF